jgi:AcrR family transcriptional regulator
MVEGPDSTGRRVGAGGRRIDSSRDAVILQAALDGLAERGYDLLTMDEIAARARAGKGAIYRRWPSKAALVADAVVAWRDQLRPSAPPDTGSLRGDVDAMTSSMPDSGQRRAGRSASSWAWPPRPAGILSCARRCTALFSSSRGGRSVMSWTGRSHAARSRRAGI